MTAQLIFLTLFLGLTTGPATVALQADPKIDSIRLELDGRAVATIAHAPWTARIDFGSELTPQTLVAIGYDAHRSEIARTSQIVNLPRPMAEVEILVRTEQGHPVAQLVARHREHSPPKEATLFIDGVKIPVEKDLRARLPELDWSRPHVLSAMVRFQDGQVARRETLLRGSLGETVSSEVTPVLVTMTARREPASLDGCFLADGNSLHASALEKTNALVEVVKDPDARDIITALHPVDEQIESEWWNRPDLRYELRLDRGAVQRVLWPITETFKAPGEPTYNLFPPSPDVDSTQGGMTWLLTRSRTPIPDKSQPRRFTDAVAVAGLDVYASGRRRAVVLLLSGAHDASQFSPAVVRRYLQELGVPLFVWSLNGAKPDPPDAWGPIEDISAASKFGHAFDQLQRALREQRIAWIAADPLTSLRIKGSAVCGLKPVAQSAQPR